MAQKSMTAHLVELTIPNVITNITVPLLGMVDLAIVGHMGGGDYIGAIAIGTAIFNLIYWNFGFLRMGTTGMTAQAYGARDLKECVGVLSRAVSISLIAAALILIIQIPLFSASRYFMNISSTIDPIVQQYFFVRIWAAPATISLYAFKGWFIGMQNSRIPMIIALILNIVNIVTSIFFAYTMGMGIMGVALGTVLAQYSGLIAALIFLFHYYRKVFQYFAFRESVVWSKMSYFFNINKDIFLRTLCLLAVYTFFTSASSKISDEVLASNTILMQLFTLFSYIMDGYAFSAESLAGRYYGAGNYKLLRRCVSVVNRFGLISAIFFTFIYLFALSPILHLFTSDEAALSLAMNYRWWVAAIPLAGYLAFIYDGISGGMTKTVIMRNTIFASTIIFFISYYGLFPIFGNDALWFSLILFLIGRGIFQAVLINRYIRAIT